MPAYFVTIGLIGALLALMAILFVLLLSYHDMVKKFRYSQKENTYLKDHLYEQSVEILDGARKRALSLLEEAEKKANDIVASAETYTKQDDTHVHDAIASLQQKEIQTIQDAAKSHLSAYTTSLNQSEKEDLKKMEEMAKLFEQKMQEELKAVDKTLQDEVGKSQAVAEKSLASAQQAAEQEIASYKSARIAKVDDRIMEMLNRIAEDVFGKAIPLDEHQEIVIDALETAKKDLLKN